MKVNARPRPHSEAPGWSSGGGASPAPQDRKTKTVSTWLINPGGLSLIGSSLHHLIILFVCQWRPWGGVHAWNGYHLSFWRFLPCFIVFFDSKLAVFPLKRSVWELEKTIFGPEKDKWWIQGSKIPKPPEMPLKQGKTSQHHNWPRYMDCP